MATSTPAGVVRPMPIGALAKALRRYAGGSDPTTSVTPHLRQCRVPGPPRVLLGSSCRTSTPKERFARQASLSGRPVGGPCGRAGWDRRTDGGTKEERVNDFDLVLPTSVDVREVGMRDGLQLEDPVPLEAKLEMLEALVATGVRRIEATSFVSPKAVAALADADQVAAELSRWGGVLWSALVANPRGAVRAVDSGVANLDYVVSASDAHSRA